jgi:hypothetical protein
VCDGDDRLKLIARLHRQFVMSNAGAPPNNTFAGGPLI